MSKVCDLKQYRMTSFRTSLKSLYEELSSFASRVDHSKKPLSDEEIELRAKLFRKVRGQFIRVFRQRSKLSIESLAPRIGMTSADFKSFEDGLLPILDPIFFKLCDLVHARTEMDALFEKIEEAFQPGLRDRRIGVAETLKQYGLTFADKEKYEDFKRGRIYSFPYKPEDTGSGR